MGIPIRTHSAKHRRFLEVTRPVHKMRDFRSSLRFSENTDDILKPVNDLRFFCTKYDTSFLSRIFKAMSDSATTSETWWDTSKKFNDLNLDDMEDDVELVPIKNFRIRSSRRPGVEVEAPSATFEKVGAGVSAATEVNVCEIDVVTLEDSPQPTGAANDTANPAVPSEHPNVALDGILPPLVNGPSVVGNVSQDSTPDLVINLTGPTSSGSDMSPPEPSPVVSSPLLQPSVESRLLPSPDDNFWEFSQEPSRPSPGPPYGGEYEKPRDGAGSPHRDGREWSFQGDRSSSLQDDRESRSRDDPALRLIDASEPRSRDNQQPSLDSKSPLRDDRECSRHHGADHDLFPHSLSLSPLPSLDEQLSRFFEEISS